MKKIALCALLSLTGCETYVPAQDVYYETAPATVYTQPAATYIQPAAETAVYTTAQPQTVYVTEQPAASVVYIEEPVYYTPPPLPAPYPAYIPPRHFEPAPPPMRPRPPHDFRPVPNPHPDKPIDVRPPHRRR